MNDAGPVIGAATPIVRVLPQATDADAGEAAAFARLGDLVDPKAAVAITATPAAASAATTYFLIFALLFDTRCWKWDVFPGHSRIQ
jgi:hypothetical protein